MNKIGTITGEGYSLTYQIGEGNLAALTKTSSVTAEERTPDLNAQRLGTYYYWPAGSNNDPDVCSDLISGNRLLPSLIEKQVAILYGTGPMLYIDEIAEDGTAKRRYLKDAEILAWLESWQERGLMDSYKDYLRKGIRSYYHSEGVFSKWHLTKGSRRGPDGLPLVPGTLPVAGLEHISELRCRLATTQNISQKKDVVNADFPLVMVGAWRRGGNQDEFKVYPRFSAMNPTKSDGAISYSKNANFETDIYATNVFFRGIKSWIRGCNATPDYINSFLENSLSARHHVIIPNAWYNAKKAALEELCLATPARRPAEPRTTTSSRSRWATKR